MNYGSKRYEYRKVGGGIRFGVTYTLRCLGDENIGLLYIVYFLDCNNGVIIVVYKRVELITLYRFSFFVFKT